MSAPLILSILCICLPWRATLTTATPDADTAPPCRTANIRWSEHQPLRITDFQGPTRSRGLAAEASTGIETRSSGNLAEPTFHVDIWTYFEPCKSWMGSNERNAYTLAHEQLHFDITELFARRLALRYRAEISSYPQFERHHERLYNEVWDECRAMQAQYDQEVYGKPAAQQRWIKQIADQLAATPALPAEGFQLPTATPQR